MVPMPTHLVTAPLYRHDYRISRWLRVGRDPTRKWVVVYTCACGCGRTRLYCNAPFYVYPSRFPRVYDAFLSAHKSRGMPHA